MPKKTYTSAFKAKVVLEVLQEESELSAIASKYDLNPNMVRTWKKEFLEKAPSLRIPTRWKRNLAGRRQPWRRKTIRCSEQSGN